MPEIGKRPAKDSTAAAAQTQPAGPKSNRAAGGDGDYPNELWWHHHPVFHLDKWGNSSSRPGQEREFKHVWRHRERAAWTYELVRRTEVMLHNGWSCNTPVPPMAIVRTLAQLPSFDRLSSAGQRMLLACLNGRLGIRPVSMPGELHSTITQHGLKIPCPYEHYGSIGNVSFDLTASDETLKEHFLDLINQLRADFRIANPARNKGVPHRKVKWHNLDYAHDPIRFRCPQQNVSRCRSDLLAAACEHIESVAVAAYFSYFMEQRSLVLEFVRASDAVLSQMRRETGEAASADAFPAAAVLAAITAFAAKARH